MMAGGLVLVGLSTISVSFLRSYVVILGLLFLGRIGYWEYPLIQLNPFSGYIFLEAVRNLLWDKDNFPFLATLRGSESELSILNITGCQFQDLADPHPSTNLLIFRAER